MYILFKKPKIHYITDNRQYNKGHVKIDVKIRQNNRQFLLYKVLTFAALEIKS